MPELLSQMSRAADDGTVLPAATAGAPSLTVDAVIVLAAILRISLSSGDANYYLMEAYKHLKPIALAGDAQSLSKSNQRSLTRGEEDCGS